jgi:integrase
MFEFLDSCMLGLYGQKIGKPRALRTLLSLKPLCEMLPEGKIWHDVTKADIKVLLLKILEHPVWGEWETYTTLQCLRKFMIWLRTEHGYPEGYQDREKFLALLPLMKHAPEANFKIDQPKKIKNLNEIPLKEEISWMLTAAGTYDSKLESVRDTLLISLLEEIGMRIGGCGILKISDVTFDQIGALISIYDKTMRGEPVRIIKSVPALREWLKIHPFRDNPEAPLWINLRPASCRTPMTYYGMRKALGHAVETHNKTADSKGLPKITRRIHFHAFRYYAQTRDMLEGMPIPIQCRQRGWSPLSKQPQRYSRISTAQMDTWLVARHEKAEIA